MKLPPRSMHDSCAPALCPSALLDSVPAALVRAIGRLPHRLVFRNESLNLLLVGLDNANELREFNPSCQLLMIVAHGRLWLTGGNGSRWMEEGDEIHLTPADVYEMRAPNAVDLLFLIPSPQFEKARKNSMTVGVAGILASRNRYKADHLLSAVPNKSSSVQRTVNT